MLIGILGCSFFLGVANAEASGYSESSHHVTAVTSDQKPLSLSFMPASPSLNTGAVRREKDSSWTRRSSHGSLRSSRTGRYGSVDMATGDSVGSRSRRDALRKSLLAAVVALQPAQAVVAAQAPKVPSQQELVNLQLGYARVQYLVQNWEAIVNKNGEKVPLRVQDYIGYKSMKDPLFKVDKIMVRATPLVDENDVERYQETIMQYQRDAEAASGLAYTSSWGEANPGGGKERVEELLEQAKGFVEALEESLKIVLECLKLQEVPLATVSRCKADAQCMSDDAFFSKLGK